VSVEGLDETVGTAHRVAAAAAEASEAPQLSPRLHSSSPQQDPSHSTPTHNTTTIKQSLKPRKGRPNHKPNVTAALFTWLSLHEAHPYPSESEKVELAGSTGLSLCQINGMFFNFLWSVFYSCVHIGD
jgi:hypothetical protein